MPTYALVNNAWVKSRKPYSGHAAILMNVFPRASALPNWLPMFLSVLTICCVLFTTFTPGSRNIYSASIAVLHGYKNTLNYQGGLAAGVFFVMLLSGWISTTLLGIFPALEPVLRYVGAGYVLYLALGILKA